MTPLQGIFRDRLFSIMLTDRFVDLAAYLEQSERSLRGARAATQTRIGLGEIGAHLKGEPWSDDEINRAQDELRRFDESFPQAVRCSLVQLVYANFEVCILKTLDHYGDRLAQPRPAARGILFKAEEYLASCGVNSGREYWETVLHYVRVRDALVHGNGDLLDKRVGFSDETQASVAALGTVEIVGDSIVLAADAPGNFLNLTRSLCFAISRRTDA